MSNVSSTVFCEMRKWPDRGHYRFHGMRLGEDEHGIWIGAPAGIAMLGGPVGDHVTSHAFVSLVPRESWYIASWYDRRGHPDLDIALYVDITTPPEWLADDHVMVVDLDLDVVLGFDGSLFIDDEDEFAEHQVLYGYPAEVVSGARTTADDVLAKIQGGIEPFGSAYVPWLERLLGEAVDVP